MLVIVQGARTPVKYFITAIVALYAFSHLPALAHPERGYKLEIVESSDAFILCTITFDSAQICQKKVKSDWLTDISMPGCAFTDQEGWPRLPVTSLVLGIPATGTPRLSFSNELETKSLGNILSVDKQAAKNGDAAEPGGGLSQKVITGWYPDQVAELGVTGFIRDQRTAQIELHPVRYSSSSGLTQMVRSLSLRIDFERTEAAGTQAAFSSPAKISADGFEPVLKSRLANYESAKTWRMGSRQARIPPLAESSTTPSGFKFQVQEDGVYAVAGRELENAGADLAAIVPSTLALSNRGKPVPIIVEGEADGSFDETDRIIFVGEHNPGDNSHFSWYSDTNVYWLDWNSGAGARFAEVSGAPDGNPADEIRYSQVLVHLEVDTTYQRLLNVTDESLDHWFWQILSMGENYDFALPLDAARKDGSIRVLISMQGSTHPSASPDHHVVVKLNGQSIGEALWNDQNLYELDSGPVAANLQPESNTLTLSLPGDLPEVTVDQVLLNWIEIVFERELIAANDSLQFTYNPSAPGNLKINGFSSPEIYILTDYGQRITDEAVSHVNSKYSFTFKSRSTLPGSFFIVSDKRLKSVAGIIKDTPSDLHNPANGADYLIISHKDFWQQAQKLAAFRASQGLRTLVVDIQDVYDEFGYGIYDPRAIRAFLNFAYTYWAKPSPLFLLLLGDTTHEMDKAIAHKRNYRTFIPSMMQFTSSWGMTATDNYFAAVSGDDWLPDMYVGRFPANTAEEAEIMVQKTIDYESKSTIDGWSRNVFLLTGTDAFFQNSAQYLYDNYIPKSVIANFLNTDPESQHFGSTEDVARHINSGQSIVNFIGHGGGGVYFDSELFLQEDIATLHNKDKYPVAFSMTCFIGHFDNPETPSLSEELLRAPDKGFVAHFGSAGRALLQGDYFLNNALFDAIFHQDAHTVGEITTSAKFDMVSQTKSYWDHVKNYVLVGDPALRLQIAPDNVAMQLSKTALSGGDQITVSGQVSGHSSGSLQLSVYNDADSLLVSKEISLQNGAFAADLFTMNSEIRKAWGTNGGTGIVRAYFSDGQNEGKGAAVFSVNRPVISQVLLDPEVPRHNDSVYVTIRTDAQSAFSIGGIQTMTLDWTGNNSTWQRIAMQESPENFWRSVEPIQRVEGSQITLKAVIKGGNGQEYSNDLLTYSVAYRPDLSVKGQTIRISGSTQTVLSVDISNSGGSDAVPFSVTAGEDLDGNASIPIGSKITLSALKAGADTTISFVWANAVAGEKQISILADVDSTVEESNERNNLSTRALMIANVSQGSNGYFYSQDKSASMNIPANALSQNTLVTLTKKWESAHSQAASQSGLEPIKAPGSQQPFAYSIQIADSMVSMSKPVAVTVNYDPDDSTAKRYLTQNALRIYAWSEATLAWHGLVSTLLQDKALVGASLPTGYTTFSLMANGDAEAPVIQIGIEGQHFADGDVVGSHPAFTGTIEDGSGLDMGSSAVTLLLDDSQVAETDVIFFQEADSKRRVTFTFAPTLLSGQHRLKVNAADINGNLASTEVTFSITGQFELAAIANHPNPFAKETVIAFTLTEQAEKVKLAIYTVSGRLIRCFEFADVAGYVEQAWDGADEDGNQVANGVYYLKFTAKRKDKKIETIEKMARLE
jgi:hypothetical protein